MRIIAGDLKGMRLFSPKDLPIRPTEDRTRETLFNILQPIVPDALVLDLYGGTGAVALEFLSRGAGFAHINDLSKDSIRLIMKNVAHTKMEERCLITNADAVRKLKKMQRMEIRFDYIYIDPPFGEGFVKRALTAIDICDILSANGLVITEQERGAQPVAVESLTCFDTRVQGAKSLHFYRGANHASCLPGEF